MPGNATVTKRACLLQKKAILKAKVHSRANQFVNTESNRCFVHFMLFITKETLLGAKSKMAKNVQHSNISS